MALGRIRSGYAQDGPPEVGRAAVECRSYVDAVGRDIVSLAPLHRKIRRSGVRPEIPEMIGRAKRFRVVLPFRWLSFAELIYLSTYFGLLAGRLVRCETCGEPFLRSSKRPRQRTCNLHLKRHSLPTHRVTWLGTSPLGRRLRKYWRRLQNRLDQNVHRAKLSPGQRQRKLAAAKADIGRVLQGKQNEEEWLQKHLRGNIDRQTRPLEA